MRMGILYLMLGVWLHRMGIEPRTCTRQAGRAGRQTCFSSLVGLLASAHCWSRAD